MTAPPVSQPFNVRQLLSGASGALPVAVGTATLWLIFTAVNPRFLTAENLTNLLLQTATIAIIAMAAAVVLLLGEIDLSLGSISGLAAAVMGVLGIAYGLPGILTLLLAVLTGLALGALQGTVIRRIGLPSFVVTLGGLLTWQGAQLAILGDRGNININDPFITGLTSTYLPNAIAFGLTVVTLVYVTAQRLLAHRSRARAGLPVSPKGALVASLSVQWGIALAVVALFASHRGVPLVALIVFAVAASLHVFLTRRRIGRYVYAVGSNAEAARRAGIRVNGVVVLVFALAGGLAALGGVLAASRLYAVNAASGSGDLLLLAIAGAVIGGVSLFGGVGTVWNALLGALVIGSISNGMNLLSIPASIRFMVTGGVLVVAVGLDAVARRRGAKR